MPHFHEENEIETLVKSWDFYKKQDMRSYAYEVFVQISDHFEVRQKDPGLAHPLLSAMEAELQNLGINTQKTFEQLWSKK